MKNIVFVRIAWIALVSAVGSGAPAQTPVPPPAAIAPYRSPTELDQLLGPIALYPDPLNAEILPAATLPSEIVVADRYVRSGADPNQVDLQPWDPSIKALARYPSVLAWMDDNLAWTTDLGQAFLTQPADVMNSIQRLRGRALALGNLQTTPQQTVINQNGLIEIIPANPQIIYVPAYQPQYVYYQPPPRPGFYVSFSIGLPIGIWLNHDFDWHDRRIIYWGHDHPRPVNWWYHPSDRRIAEIHTEWHPRIRPPLGIPDHGDRGWQRQDGLHARVVAPPVHTERPAPPRVERPVPVAPRREERRRAQQAPSGPLIGVHSTPQTREYSTRGQESRHAAAPAAPARPTGRTAPAAHTGAERDRR